MSRKTIKIPTIKRLYAKSGNQCAFPSCTQQLFMDSNSKNVSEICHIEAAEKGGPRYNPESTDEERRSYDNLIILCPTHHAITDNAVQYPVEKLKLIKTEHESKITQALTEQKPQIFSEVINALTNVNWRLESQIERIESFSIEEKIEFNNITKWKPIVNEYKQYQGKINSVYSTLEASGNIFKKEKLLHLIHQIYLKIKGDHMEKNPAIEELQIIQLFADSILDEVEKKLIAAVKNNNYDTVIAMPIIMVDAFMRCKILEEPPTR